jgi:hypothetical protein
MRCTPQECPHCREWGPDVVGGTKTQCHYPHEPEGFDTTFRFSTTLGGPCVIEKERERGEQQSLWGEDD